MRGTIVSINVSDGGLPKLPVSRRIEVNRGGIEGDRQRNLEVHGGPERAVCLYSLERIKALEGEGGSIRPGAIGENITVKGMNWGLMTPGVRLKIGNNIVSLLLEISAFTGPCRHVADYLPGRDMTRILETKNPGWSRVYARVLQEGSMAVGDRIKIIHQ